MMKYFLDATIAKEILDAMEQDSDEITISLDLGRSTTTASIKDSNWDSTQLKKIVKDPNTIYFIEDGEAFKAAISSTQFYKLMPSGRGTAPALVISGVAMHRVKDMDPIKDAAMKAELCAKNGNDMLEICTGLGYSTIECLKRGVRSIVTIEKDNDVIQLSSINPWSREIFSDSRVTLVHGDATEKISEFEDSRFHSILHDPPTFTMGSDLYTREFYSEIYRVLKRKGTLFHYVGSPGAKYRRRDVQKGVIQRLRDVGFRNVKRKKDALGVLARK
ncbi:MAG: RsmD family RNA methyltransferase [Candidatus Thorarchaeota archaeon]